jgi:hypothetical protein
VFPARFSNNVYSHHILSAPYNVLRVIVLGVLDLLDVLVVNVPQFHHGLVVQRLRILR